MTPSNQVPPLDSNGQSVFLIGLITTPSARFFEIVRYDKAHKKTQPWRTVQNNPVHVTHYQELPEMPNE